MWKITSASFSLYNAKIDPMGIQGSQLASTSVENPSWVEAKTMIEQLDGDRCDTMGLDGPDNYSMTIGGGPDHFVVSVIGDNMGPYSLLGPTLSDEQICISCGGVMTNLEKRFICFLPAVLQAAEYFYHHGNIDPDLRWHEC